MSIFRSFLLLMLLPLTGLSNTGAGRVDVPGGRVTITSGRVAVGPQDEFIYFEDNVGGGIAESWVTSTVPTSVFDIAKPWTISLWCQPTVTPDTYGGGLVSLHYSGGPSYYQAELRMAGSAMDVNKLTFRTYDVVNGENYVWDDSALEVGVLYHVVLTYDGIDTLKLWRDGTLKAAANPYVIPARTSTGIGIGTCSAIAGDYDFPGYMSQVALWTNVLSDGAIGNLYNDGAGRVIPPSEEGLVALWNFDGSVVDSGTNAFQTALITESGATVSYVRKTALPVPPVNYILDPVYSGASWTMDYLWDVENDPNGDPGFYYGGPGNYGGSAWESLGNMVGDHSPYVISMWMTVPADTANMVNGNWYRLTFNVTLADYITLGGHVNYFGNNTAWDGYNTFTADFQYDSSFGTDMPKITGETAYDFGYLELTSVTLFEIPAPQ